MKITVEKFSGIAPIVDPRKLAEDMAQLAKNCLFEEHTLRPLRAPLVTDVTLQSDTLTMFDYSGTLLEFDEVVDIARSPLHNDEFDRIYITDSQYPKVRAGASTYRLGIPRPTAALTATATSVPDDEDAEQLLEAETIYYVHTLVDGFGAEGPPSAVSAVVNRIRDTDVNLAFPTLPSGEYNFSSAALIRVYRSNTGSQDTGFQFAFEVPISTSTYTDTVLNENLQEALPSTTWVGPPDDDSGWVFGPLQGIVACTNGVLAGFSGYTVYLSEPYLPHAWPYRYSSKSRIVGLVSISSGLLVLTQGKPFLLSGSDPSSYSEVPVQGDSQLPCVAKRSIVDMGDYAIYATDNGLALVEGVTATLITKDLLGKTQWAAYSPSSLISNVDHGRYIGFYNTGSVQGALIFDPMGGKNAITTSDLYASTLYHAPANGSLYLKDGTTLCVWDAAEDMTYEWHSKDFVTPFALSFAYLEIVGTFADLQVTLYADGQELILNPESQYTLIPGVLPAFKWSIKFTGSDEIVFAALKENLYEDV